MSYAAISFYDKTTGLFTGRTLRCSGHSVETLGASAQEGEGFVEGLHDHVSSKVDLQTGKVIDYQPPQPSADHEWDATAKRWKLTAAAEQREIRRQNALRQIAALEAAQARPHRELTLDPANIQARQRLEAIEKEIASLRAQLA